LNLLFVSDSTTVSGAEIVMLGYLDGLKALGHHAYAYVSDRNPRLIAAFKEQGVPVVATGSYSPETIRTTVNPLVVARFGRSFLRVAREMTSLVRTARVDLIHSISYPASLYAAFAAGRTGTPQVWHEHNIKKLHPVNRVIYRRVANTCRWIIGPSDAVTGNLARSGIPSAKLRTVYNGIDLRKFRSPGTERIEGLRRELGLAAGQKAVGLFGQMLTYKGHRTLIEAAPSILREHPQTKFFFVGALENPPYQRELEQRLDSLGVAHDFTFTGWRSDVQDIMRAMDVIVVGTTTPEPAALALMEGTAMERPLVATRTGGTPEIIVDGETGLLFAPGSADELAAAVKKLLGDPALARRLGLAGRARVEQRFTRELHLDSMFKLYDEAVRSRQERSFSESPG